MYKQRTWQDRENEEGFSWHIYRDRVKYMSKFINDDDKSVIDLGAGDMYLKECIPTDVKYFPVDYIKRSAETIICDFNKNEFPEFNVDVDVAFVSGCLEYVENYDYFLISMVNIVNKIILSYTPVDYISDISYRQSRGWKSHLRLEYLKRFFKDNNFRLIEENVNIELGQIIICYEKNKIKNVTENILCSGCLACVDICPTGALTISKSLDGTYVPAIVENKCINCGKCIEKCPTINPVYKNSKEPECFAFDGPDRESFTSATAGIFQMLAKDFLSKGGKVVGAVWDDNDKTLVRHVMINSIEQLPPMLKSKYVQSYMGDIISQTKAELKKGTNVLFSGLSCQVAGLYAALDKDYDNLYTVDLICHHAPSSKYFQDYLDETFGKNNVEEFDFRAKEIDDRYKLKLKVRLKDGTVKFINHADDTYCELFHKRYIMNITCENCRFARYPKQGDLTLGDFHSIEQTDPRFLDFRTEALLSNNEKGKKLFEMIKDKAILCEKQSLSILPINNKVCTNYPAHPSRDRMIALARKMSITRAADYIFKNKYDIGLVGMAGNRNYGGGLTYFALYKVLNDFGKTVLMIDQPEESFWKPHGDRCMFKNDPYQPFDIAKSYANKDAMRELNNYCDMFLVGSDQFFGTVGMYQACAEFVSLEWVYDYKQKSAYAASFGRDEISCDEHSRAKMAYYMQKFDYFSVREKSGVDICLKDFEVKAQWVLDPVFLCKKEYFDELVQLGTLKLKGVLSYILDKNENTNFIVNDISSRMKLPVAEIGDSYKDKNYNGQRIKNAPYMEDWLSSIANSEFVITDSFHGICFAIIYKKPFIAICNESRGATRFESLVSLLGLEDRLVYNLADYERIKDNLSNIDWENVYKKLLEAKKLSFDFLEKAIDISKVKKPLSDYDIMAEKINEIKSQLVVKTEQEFYEKVRDQLIIKNEEELIEKIKQQINQQNFRKTLRFKIKRIFQYFRTLYR